MKTSPAFVFAVLLTACVCPVDSTDSASTTPTSSTSSTGRTYCRPDCEPGCPAGHTCIICSPDVAVIDLGCSDEGPACNGIRWQCPGDPAPQ